MPEPGTPQVWEIRSLDVWGHAPGGPDCECGKDGTPDADRCEGFTINQSFRVGTITVPTKRRVYNRGTAHEFTADHAEDSDVLAALVEGTYLAENAAGMVEIDDHDGDGTYLDVVSAVDNEPLYTLVLQDGDGPT